jgi:hypothetical protein
MGCDRNPGSVTVPWTAGPEEENKMRANLAHRLEHSVVNLIKLSAPSLLDEPKPKHLKLSVRLSLLAALKPTADLMEAVLNAA